MLNIFNNGSSTWILLIADIIWVAIWGYRTIKSQNGEWERQTPTGIVNAPAKHFWQNGNFKMLVIGIVGIIGFLIWINSDYR